MSIWDDPEIATGDYFKFTEVGDKLTGKIKHIAKSRFNDDGKVSIELQILTDDGETVSVTAPARLKAKLVELRPGIGDRISIELTGYEPTKGRKPAMLFDVSVS